MKQSFLSIINFLILSFLTIFCFMRKNLNIMNNKLILPVLFILCFTSQMTIAQNLKNCKSFSLSLNGDAIISIDPRIEFFQVFNLIAGNPNINRIDTDYKTDILDYFGKYKDHPSIEYLLANFLKIFGSIDAPYSLLPSLELDFTFRKNVIEDRWKNHQEIDDLLAAFKQFAEDTDFETFFNSQSDFYSLLINNTAYALSDFNEKKRMLGYYGNGDGDSHAFYLIINVLGGGNFGIGLTTNTQEEHYAIVSPGRAISGIPIYSKQDLESLIWHEFGHSFTNPLVDKYWADLEKLSHLHAPIKESMASQAYPEWKTVLYEHMTRALTCRFEANKYGEKLAEYSQERIEAGRRFIYVAPIIEQLKDYEQNRSKYPSLDSFMPQIVDRMKGISDEDITKWNREVEDIRKPDVENIPSNVDFFQRENQLMILSTFEEDTIADQQLKKFLSERFANLPTMDDTVALKTDLSKYNLLAIGSFNGNEFIKKHIESLPIHMDSDHLIAGKVYTGTGYAFLTGWVHPQNPENVMTLYIAQNPKDLVNFTWVRRGGADYHIINNLVTLKADDYQRLMGIWMCR